MRVRTLEDRFWAKVAKTDACWVWQGCAYRGYGQIGKGRRGDGQMLVHRLSWQLANGPIPEGMTIDHLCQNRRCVNPAHMEVVTRGENTLRGSSLPALNSRKTHCKRGHSLEDAIVNRRGERQCRECNRLKRHYFRHTGHAVIPEDAKCA